MILSEEEYKKFMELKKPLEAHVRAALVAANDTVAKTLNRSGTGSALLSIRESRDTYFIDEVTDVDITSITKVGSTFELKGNAVYVGNGKIIFTIVPPTGNYIVKYTAKGEEYSDNIKHAVALLVDYWVSKDYRTAKSIGSESVSFTIQSTGLPKHIRTLLDLERIL